MQYVVIGGGIAGVCCAIELTRCLRQNQQEQQQGAPSQACDDSAREVGPRPRGPEQDPESQELPHGAEPQGGDQVVLVSSSPVIKGVREVARLSRLVEELEVVESPLSNLATGSGGVLRVVLGTVAGMDLEKQELRLEDGSSLSYDKVCVCTGARPKDLGVPGSDHPAVMTLRDTDSVRDLSRRLRGCRRLVLVGNGGIALELAGALTQAEEAQLQRRGQRAQSGKQAPCDERGAGGGEAYGSGGVSSGNGGSGGPDAGPAGAGPAGAVAGSSSPELVWVLKHGHLGDAFFDVDAAAFLAERLQGEAAAGAETAAAGWRQEGKQQAQQGKGQEEGEEAPAERAQQGDPHEQFSSTGGPIADTTTCAAASTSSGAHGGRVDPRVGRQVGHAAGPAWSRELLRGLKAAAMEEEEGAEEGEATPAKGGDSTALAGGAPPPPLPVGSGEQQRGADAESSRGRGGFGGRGPSNFRVVLEFSTTVEEVRDGLLGGGGDGGGGGSGGASQSPGSPPESWPLHVALSNGKVYGADLAVVAIGVDPATSWLPPRLPRAPDGGLKVDRRLRTTDPRVFAAGDCCSTSWEDGSPHWFQMRLWTQARLMGLYAAHCMLDLEEQLGSGFSFELFAHVTRFLGAKVVLLGLYNGQGLEKEPSEDIQLYSRVATGACGQSTFVRVLLLRGRMQGAILLGETELEEAFENLILNNLDLTSYGGHILDEDFELEHFFD